MTQRSVVVASPVGLHARPAAVFTRAVTASGLPVTIRKEDGPAVSAASILAVLQLNVGQGERVTLEVEGEGADELLDALAGLLSQDHHEAESR